MSQSTSAPNSHGVARPFATTGSASCCLLPLLLPRQDCRRSRRRVPRCRADRNVRLARRKPVLSDQWLRDFLVGRGPTLAGIFHRALRPALSRISRLHDSDLEVTVREPLMQGLMSIMSRLAVGYRVQLHRCFTAGQIRASPSCASSVLCSFDCFAGPES
jgi:hypothetical protein